MSNFDYQIKVAVVGDSGVGKTTMLQRYYTRLFDSDLRATVGIEFRSKIIKINDTNKPNVTYNVKAHIYDTQGSERFMALTPQYYRHALGAIIVYDITKHETFRNVGIWLEEIRRHATNPNFIIILVGNKSDLAPNQRTVPTEEAARFMQEHQLAAFLETSAKDNTNIDLVFEKLIKGAFNVYMNTIQPVPRADVIRIRNEQPNQQRCFAANIPFIGRFF